ncbi:MAG TPA: hypothetical protein VID75_02965 [Acidimicrobiales bacterium]|jgi:hypothetical protein
MTVAPLCAAPRQRALDFLRSHSAETMPHLNGSLLTHLLATEALLRSWGSSEGLCRAGLCHATYGTHGFAPCLLPPHDRATLTLVVGDDVEKTVYLYGACDRAVVYPQLAAVGPVSFRDRFRDETVVVTEGQIRDFVDLTLANELDVALSGRRRPDDAPPDWIAPFVGQLEHRASPRVRRAARWLLDCLP